RVDALVEAKDDRARRPCEPLLERRRLVHEARVRERRGRKRQRREHCDDESIASHRCGTPASCDRCPKIGATSRSEKRSTATTSRLVAKPSAAVSERGLSACASGKSAATRSVQPSAWCRKAARENSRA